MGAFTLRDPANDDERKAIKFWKIDAALLVVLFLVVPWFFGTASDNGTTVTTVPAETLHSQNEQERANVEKKCQDLMEPKMVLLPSVGQLQKEFLTLMQEGNEERGVEKKNEKENNDGPRQQHESMAVLKGTLSALNDLPHSAGEKTKTTAAIRMAQSLSLAQKTHDKVVDLLVEVHSGNATTPNTTLEEEGRRTKTFKHVSINDLCSTPETIPLFSLLATNVLTAVKEDLLAMEQEAKMIWAGSCGAEELGLIHGGGGSGSEKKHMKSGTHDAATASDKSNGDNPPPTVVVCTKEEAVTSYCNDMLTEQDAAFETLLAEKIKEVERRHTSYPWTSTVACMFYALLVGVVLGKSGVVPDLDYFKYWIGVGPLPASPTDRAATSSLPCASASGGVTHIGGSHLSAADQTQAVVTRWPNQKKRNVWKDAAAQPETESAENSNNNGKANKEEHPSPFTNAIPEDCRCVAEEEGSVSSTDDMPLDQQIIKRRALKEAAAAHGGGLGGKLAAGFVKARDSVAEKKKASISASRHHNDDDSTTTTVTSTAAADRLAIISASASHVGDKFRSALPTPHFSGLHLHRGDEVGNEHQLDDESNTTTATVAAKQRVGEAVSNAEQQAKGGMSAAKTWAVTHSTSSPSKLLPPVLSGDSPAPPHPVALAGYSSSPSSNASSSRRRSRSTGSNTGAAVPQNVLRVESTSTHLHIEHHGKILLRSRNDVFLAAFDAVAAVMLEEASAAAAMKATGGGRSRSSSSAAAASNRTPEKQVKEELEAKIETLQAQLADARDERARLEAKLRSEFDEQLSLLASQHDSETSCLRQEHTAAFHDALSKSTSEKEKENAKLVEELQQLQSQYDAVQEQLKSAETRLQEMVVVLETQQKESKEELHALATAQKEHREVLEEEQKKAQEEHLQAVQELETSCLAAEEKASAAQEEKTKLEEALEKAQADVEATYELRRAMESEVEELKESQLLWGSEKAELEEKLMAASANLLAQSQCAETIKIDQMATSVLEDTEQFTARILALRATETEEFKQLLEELKSQQAKEVESIVQAHETELQTRLGEERAAFEEERETKQREVQDKHEQELQEAVEVEKRRAEELVEISAAKFQQDLAAAVEKAKEEGRKEAAEEAEQQREQERKKKDGSDVEKDQILQFFSAVSSAFSMAEEFLLPSFLELHNVSTEELMKLQQTSVEKKATLQEEYYQKLEKQLAAAEQAATAAAAVASRLEASTIATSPNRSRAAADDSEQNKEEFVTADNNEDPNNNNTTTSLSHHSSPSPSIIHPANISATSTSSGLVVHQQSHLHDEGSSSSSRHNNSSNGEEQMLRELLIKETRKKHRLKTELELMQLRTASLSSQSRGNSADQQSQLQSHQYNYHHHEEHTPGSSWEGTVESHHQHQHMYDTASEQHDGSLQNRYHSLSSLHHQHQPHQQQLTPTDVNQVSRGRGPVAGHRYGSEIRDKIQNNSYVPPASSSSSVLASSAAPTTSQLDSTSSPSTTMPTSIHAGGPHRYAPVEFIPAAHQLSQTNPQHAEHPSVVLSQPRHLPTTGSEEFTYGSHDGHGDRRRVRHVLGDHSRGSVTSSSGGNGDGHQPQAPQQHPLSLGEEVFMSMINPSQHQQQHQHTTQDDHHLEEYSPSSTHSNREDSRRHEADRYSPPTQTNDAAGGLYDPQSSERPKNNFMGAVKNDDDDVDEVMQEEPPLLADSDVSHVLERLLVVGGSGDLPAAAVEDQENEECSAVADGGGGGDGSQ